MDVFSVQRVSRDGVVDASDCVTIQAQCAVRAGEVVLAERLSLHGEVIRAKVWTLKDDFTPHSISLYAAQQGC
jgi:hypothetical protein